MNFLKIKIQPIRNVMSMKLVQQRFENIKLFLLKSNSFENIIIDI